MFFTTEFRNPTEADIVLLVGGAARKPDMTRDDLFKLNVNVVEEVVTTIADKCPKALVGIITNPVNSCVPVAAEILKEVCALRKFNTFML